VLLEYEYPVFLLTKSDLVLRDIELIMQINEKAFANICFSITQTDEETRGLYEPHSSSTWERLEALRELRNAGIKGGVMAMPMIPYISDSVENMKQLVTDAKSVDSEFILFAGMTLKPGRQKIHFLDTVTRNNPEYLAQIKEIYALENRYGQPDYSKLSINVMTVGHHICKLTGVNPRSVRHRCPDEYKSNHKVLQILLDTVFWMNTILGYRNSDWNHLYSLAVRVEKGLPNLRHAYENGVLGDIVGRELVSMVSEIIQTGTCALYEKVKQEVDRKAEKDFNRQDFS